MEPASSGSSEIISLEIRAPGSRDPDSGAVRLRAARTRARQGKPQSPRRSVMSCVKKTLWDAGR
eukprot:10877021-Heterocapsa_arctica.AAC.1